jgi:hypothetical protein
MAYTVATITELIHYHLVLAEPDDETADRNLSQLAGEIKNLATRPLWREATWVFCDRCGTSVDTELLHPDGHHYSDDGDFYCADCWLVEPSED